MCFVNKRKIIFKKIKSGKDYFESDEKTWMWLNQKEARTVPLLPIRVFRCLITFILTFLFNSFYKGHFLQGTGHKNIHFILFSAYQGLSDKVFCFKMWCSVEVSSKYILSLDETNEFHYIIILTFKYRHQHFDSVLWLTCLTEQRVSPIM